VSLLRVSDLLKDADDLVVASSVDDLAVRRPADGVDDDLLEAGGELSAADGRLVAGLSDLDLSLDGLVLEVKDLDALDGSGSDEELLGVEDDAVDSLADLDGEELLALLEVPEDDLAVLAGRGAHRAVRRDGDGVDVGGVAGEVVLEGEVLKAPDLHKAVPAGSDADGLSSRGGAEGDGADPLRVAALAEHVLLLTDSVPEAGGAVAGAREDLTVVVREGNREDVLLVADKAAGGDALLEVPEAEGAVPGGGDSIASVVGEAHVADKVAVAVKTTKRTAVALGLAGELPDKKALVARARDEDVGLLVRDSKAGDGTVVAVKSTNVLVGHVQSVLGFKRERK